MSEKHLYDLIIVGAGPAGIAAALEAKRAGINDVLILEKGLSHSTMIRTYYKEGKRVDARYAGLEAVCHGVLCLRDGDRESYLDFIDSVVQDNKLNIKHQSEVWSLKKMQREGIFVIKANDGFLHAKAIVVAIGKMGRPRQPDYFKEIPGVLKKNMSILFDINKRELSGNKVLVVGGGDSAGEYADILREKNEVCLSYRRAEFSKMNPINQGIVEKLIRERKIRAYLPSNISGISEENEKAVVHFEEAEFADERFDAVLYALGGITPLAFLNNSNIATSEKGEVVVDEHKQSSIEGLYIVGDLLGKPQGGGSIISGFNSAHKAVSHLARNVFDRELEASVVSLKHLEF